MEGEILNSFKRECQVLKRTRHRNLIRIITTCTKPDFKALVLPLMPNGSLENHLYPIHGSEHNLSLVQVVNICSDIAEGMAYLHHYSPVRVIHCDLKPSNILLNDDMTALVTDFGIARFAKSGGEGSYRGKNTSVLDPSSSFPSTAGLLCGSIGYIPPEYGMGMLASTQGDVYSFGVLILEILTGKRPTDVLFHQGSSLPQWVKTHYPDRLEPILNRAVLTHPPPLTSAANINTKIWKDVVLEMVELGLICTQNSASMRPSMLDVANEMGCLKQFEIIGALQDFFNPEAWSPHEKKIAQFASKQQVKKHYLLRGRDLGGYSRVSGTYLEASAGHFKGVGANYIQTIAMVCG
ncbi:hypothetical protein Syun_025182 [Stephania yunnanensis]|uniref:non-specific serine/threonine protein kinase n=1 Tax=Stephania yunnanensis TaxID=152371 RepID=A0AAP0EU48_9MAGN